VRPGDLSRQAVKEVLPGTGTSSINLDNISVNPTNGTVVPDWAREYFLLDIDLAD
jgi:hypothetical protein